MPYITSDGFDTYYELVGDGPPLAIYHGMTGSLESFKDPGFSQYLELQRNYKLILVDIRGHGKSSKSHNPNDYISTKFASDLCAILDRENIHKANVLGVSLGARLCYVFHKYMRPRLNTLIIGEAHPYEISEAFAKKLRNSLAGGIESIVQLRLEGYRQKGQELPNTIRDRLLQIDPEALLSLIEHPDSPWNLKGLDNCLNNTEIPILLFCGTKDPFYKGVEQVSQVINNVDYLRLDGHDHAAVVTGASEIIPRIESFLKKHN